MREEQKFTYCGRKKYHGGGVGGFSFWTREWCTIFPKLLNDGITLEMDVNESSRPPEADVSRLRGGVRQSCDPIPEAEEDVAVKLAGTGHF